MKLVSEVRDADLDRVVDKRWTPPVTLGVRLVSVLDDDMQHVGQAAFVRGIVLRRASTVHECAIGVAMTTVMAHSAGRRRPGRCR